MKPILEETGLKSGEDFYLAFSPEREDPGNENFSTKHIPKIVSGDDEKALALADALYSRIVKRTVSHRWKPLKPLSLPKISFEPSTSPW